MSGGSQAQKKADELMQRALQEKFNGEFEKSLYLMDEAMAVLEKAGIDSYQYRIQKELLLFDTFPSKNFLGLISTVQNSLEQYERQENLVKQIDALIIIAGLLVHAGNNQEALHYLDKAEKLLSSSSPEIISKYLHKNSAISGELFLLLRQKEVMNIKEHLVNP